MVYSEGPNFSESNPDYRGQQNKRPHSEKKNNSTNSSTVQVLMDQWETEFKLAQNQRETNFLMLVEAMAGTNKPTARGTAIHQS